LFSEAFRSIHEMYHTSLFRCIWSATIDLKIFHFINQQRITSLKLICPHIRWCMHETREWVLCFFPPADDLLRKLNDTPMELVFYMVHMHNACTRRVQARTRARKMFPVDVETYATRPTEYCLLASLWANK
jgi:hypothetical protein